MLPMSVPNLLANMVLEPHVSWALVPIAVFPLAGADGARGHAAGAGPVPERRRAWHRRFRPVLVSVANGLVAGVEAPLVMHSPCCWPAASLGMMAGVWWPGWCCSRRWPDTGQHIPEHSKPARLSPSDDFCAGPGMSPLVKALFFVHALVCALQCPRRAGRPRLAGCCFGHGRLRCWPG